MLKISFCQLANKKQWISLSLATYFDQGQEKEEEKKAILELMSLNRKLQRKKRDSLIHLFNNLSLST